MERRDLFRIIGAAAATAGSGMAQAGPRFFTAEEFRALEALCGAILPADEEAGGAVEAGVPRYIDTVVFYADAATKEFWRRGLGELGKVGELRELTEKERAPETEAERFFVRLKAITIEAYFQSEIGMKYLGHRGHSGVHWFPGCRHPEHLS
jgi:hypothetical protein